MRKAVRSGAFILLAYLFQATALTYFKVNGVTLDLVSVVLYTVGFSLGLYAGVTGGLLGALVMEVVSGDLPGVISVSCVAAGALGALVGKRVREFTRVGKRTQERLVKRFAPMVVVGLFVIVREAIYVVYFYLTGVDIVFMHISRMLIAGVFAALVAVPLLPVLYGFLTRKDEETFVAKWRRKQKTKGEAKSLSPVKPPPAASPEGGTQL